MSELVRMYGSREGHIYIEDLSANERWDVSDRSDRSTGMNDMLAVATGHWNLEFYDSPDGIRFEKPRGVRFQTIASYIDTEGGVEENRFVIYYGRTSREANVYLGVTPREVNIAAKAPVQITDVMPPGH